MMHCSGLTLAASPSFFRSIIPRTAIARFSGAQYKQTFCAEWMKKPAIFYSQNADKRIQQVF
jgi:hypothetical protein